MAKNKKDPKPKQFTFTNDEFLYVSEKRSFIEIYDNLIRRFIAAKVLPRINIDPKENLVKLSQDNNGVEVTPLPKAEVKEPPKAK